MQRSERTINSDIMGKWETAVFLLILVLAIYLRLVWLGNNSLWTDEFHTWRVAQEARFWREGIPGDQHPPLYYLLMQLVAGYNTSEFWLRLPSAVFSLLTLPMVWLIGHALHWPRFSRLATSLFALSPLFIWYARDARMYSMAAFFWVVALYFYIQSITKDHWFNFWGLAVSHLAGIFTAYPTLALWFLQVGLFPSFWYLTGHRWRRLWGWLVAQAVVVAGLWWWSPYFTLQMGRTFLFEWQLGPLAATWTLQQTAKYALLAGVGVLGMLVAGTAVFIWQPFRWQLRLQTWLKQQTTLAAWLAVGLLLVVVIIGTIPRGLSVRRQFLVFIPLVIGAGTWGLLFLNQRWLIGLVLVISLVGATLTAFSPPYENWKETIIYLEQNTTSGDIIIAVPGWQELAFDYYYLGDNLLLRADDQGRLRTINSVVDAETAVFTPGQRIWVAQNSHPSVIDYSQGLLHRLDAAGTQVQQMMFTQHVTLLLYRMK